MAVILCSLPKKYLTPFKKLCGIVQYCLECVQYRLSFLREVLYLYTHTMQFVCVAEGFFLGGT